MKNNIGERIRQDNGENVSKLAIPDVLKKVFVAAHSIVYYGTRRMIHMLFKRCRWPNMEQDVGTFCKQCIRCNTPKPPLVHNKSLTGNLLAPKPFELVTLDFYSFGKGYQRS